MTTCTRCTALVELIPQRPGSCPGWPCHARPRPEATARLDALLHPGQPDVAPLDARPPVRFATSAEFPPAHAPRGLARLRPRRRPAARIPVQAVAAVLVTEAASGR
ncbi:hypothetical protein OG196_42835 [Kitasatospora purpeofusca]|uniref:hypothetical protein n=1 Tax=Kitasatospora purpeofusca TaxID=67352 RepID=UPI002E0F75A3|nr:hypothetical protein OG196_00090 [Kitasatospora purpeofusca]WSR45242.1 hypothetical protein OG196_42835 [Kitasatospora purpeofusca]